MKELCAMLGVSQNISTAFHPQTDGQSERANQRVEQYLRIYGNAEQNDWAQLLPLAQFVHNTWTNETTGRTPYELLHQQIGQNILSIFRALPEPKTFSVHYNALQAFIRQRKGS
jgi:hypothetical protein